MSDTTSKKIFVTGATGNVGGEVIKQLAARPDLTGRVVAAVRPGSTTKANLPVNVETVPFDFTRPETFADAFRDVGAVFLVRPPKITNAERDIKPALDAAQAAGVKRVVFLSVYGASKAPFIPHARIEKLLEKTTMAWTFLRAGFFDQNLTMMHVADVRDRDEVFLPAGNGKTSFIDVRDIAAVGVRALTEDGHANKAYPLTGDVALDYTEVAAILTNVLGRPIKYRKSNLIQYPFAMRAQGHPWGEALLYMGVYAPTFFGMAGGITDDVRKLLGRPAIRFEQFARDYAAMWQPNREKSAEADPA